MGVKGQVTPKSQDYAQIVAVLLLEVLGIHERDESAHAADLRQAKVREKSWGHAGWEDPATRGEMTIAGEDASTVARSNNHRGFFQLSYQIDTYL